MTNAKARHGLNATFAGLLFLFFCSPAFPQEGPGISLALEEGKSGAVWDCVISPAGDVLYTCGRDSTAKAWNTVTGEGIRTLRLEHSTLNTCLALNLEGRILAVGDMNGVLALWETEFGRLLHSFKAHDAYITAVSFTPSGRSIVTSGRDGRVRVWDVASRDTLAEPLIDIDAQSVWVNGMALAPDGALIVTAGQDGSIRSWDTYTGASVLKYGTHSRFAKSVAFSRDGTTILSGGRGGEVKVWNARSGVFMRSFRVASGFPRELTLSPDGNTLCISTANGTLEAWDWAQGRKMKELSGASYGAMASCFSPEGNRLFSVHVDGAVKVWMLKDWLHVADMVGFSDGQWLTYTPDGFYDCSAYGDRYVQWQSGQEFYPLERYDAIYKKQEIVENALAGRYVPEKALTDIIDPPKVRLIAPRKNQIYAFGTEPMEILVEAEAVDRRGINGIGLALNGRQLERNNIIETRTLVKNDSVLRESFRIGVLPGYNTIDVIAYNDVRIKSDPASAVANVMTSGGGKPNLYVFAVGINDYAPAFPDLKFAANDARALAETISRQEGTMYERVYTTVLTNKEATKEMILGAMDSFPPMSAQDVLLLFFSGHGVRAKNGKQSGYYFVASGATRETVSKSGMAWSDFAARLAKTKAGRVIMLLDACHSGAVSEGASNEKVAASLADKLGVVFASSSGNEFSFEEDSWQHGAFTKAMLGALDGEADYTGDGVVDWNEFQLYVTNTVSNLTKDSQHPMIPRLEQFGNFDLVRTQ